MGSSLLLVGTNFVRQKSTREKKRVRNAVYLYSELLGLLHEYRPTRKDKSEGQEVVSLSVYGLFSLNITFVVLEGLSPVP